MEKKPLNEGYQPMKQGNFGYQPSESEKRGYQPTVSSTTNPTPPRGGSSVKPAQTIANNNKLRFNKSIEDTERCDV